MTVYFKDGHTEYHDFGACIVLARTQAERVERFETPDKSNCGCMEGLLNALLIDAEEGAENAENAEEKVIR